MADPELFCQCGCCTQKAGSSSFVYVYSADYQPAFSVYLSHAEGLTADQLIFEVDQPHRDTNCGWPWDQPQFCWSASTADSL